jgi:hypothetical protein
MVLAPLARALAPGGRLVTVQSYGRDPGMEIIRGIWPDDEPFRTGRHELLEAARGMLAKDGPPGLRYLACDDDRAVPLRAPHHRERGRRQHRGLHPACGMERRGLCGADEDGRMTEGPGHHRVARVTRATLRRHGGLWFNVELFVIARRA